MNRFIVVSGCSGGGKSTLLAELGRRGFPVVEEPGRRIVVEETANGGTALPWIDMRGFLHRAIELAERDLAAARAASGWVFFDRGLVDARLALHHLTGEPVSASLARDASGFDRQVFLTPPWPEIYVQDRERRHGLADAEAEYRRLVDAYPKLGYDVSIIPKATVAERADFVLGVLQAMP